MLKTVLDKLRRRPKSKTKRRKDKFAAWVEGNPEGTFQEFYASTIVSALEGKKTHASLGPRLKAKSILSARKRFEEWVKLGIRPDHRVVDYGCGTLRFGRYLIEFLEADRYVGVDIDNRILAAGIEGLPSALLSEKRPLLELISPETLQRIAANKPKWVCCKGVLHHVPPSELASFFGNVAVLVHSGATGLISARVGRHSERLSKKTWRHDFACVQSILKDHEIALERHKTALGLTLILKSEVSRD